MIRDLVRNDADRQAIELVTARQEFSKSMWLRPRFPPTGSILRDAFDATTRDPELAEEARKAGLSIYGPMRGSELAAMTLKLAQTPAPVIERISQIFKNFASGR